jgi:outer membrane protein assembly factor BamB
LYAIVLLAAPAWSENWPQWRGQSGSGVSRDTGFPAEWSGTTNIAWKAPLRGLGASTPIVWNDRVIVTYQIGANALRPGVHPTLVQGADAATSGEHPLGGMRPRGSSALKIVFTVAAFDRKSGRQPWEYTFNAEGDLPETHKKRNLATPSPVTAEVLCGMRGLGSEGLLKSRNVAASVGADRTLIFRRSSANFPQYRG